MTTHVSIGGCLYKLTYPWLLETEQIPSDAQNLGIGRLVTPNCHYEGKPVVSLYQYHDRYGYWVTVAAF